MAVNCCVSPFGIEGFAGVTAIETSAAAVTVSVSLELTTLPSSAVMPLVPLATLVARPEEVLIVATAKFADAQITVFVMFCVVPSLKVPVAVRTAASDRWPRSGWSA